MGLTYISEVPTEITFLLVENYIPDRSFHSEKESLEHLL